MRRWVRAGFALYALVIFVLTHMPKLKIEGPIARTDLIIHMGVFGLWTLLITACEFFGPALSARNIARSGVVALVYSAFDEGTQAIPILGRVCAWDDWFANAFGVVTAVVAMLVAGRWQQRREAHRD